MYILTYTMEKATATHSSNLAWTIPWTEEPGGLPSMGLHMTEVTQQQQQQHLCNDHGTIRKVEFTTSDHIQTFTYVNTFHFLVLCNVKMASFQVEKPLKYSGKGPVMRSMYWDILEHTWQIHNPDWHQCGNKKRWG